MSNSCLPVSVIILTYNEEANIEACLQSVTGWAAEVFVVDSGSTDRTQDIVRQFRAHWVRHPFENYSRQRNWAQDNLTLAHEWVLHIDADEWVTPELVQSIRRFFASPACPHVDGLLISRRAIFLGRPILHGGLYPVYHLRLFRSQKGRCEDRLYDQHFVVDGVTQVLSGDLVNVITSDLTLWTAQHTRWAALEAQEQKNRNSGGRRVPGRLMGNPIERRRWWRSSVYERAPLFWRAFAYFLYRYFLQLGFLDGREGLIFHFLQGCWYRFYVDARIYASRHADEDGQK